MTLTSERLAEITERWGDNAIRAWNHGTTHEDVIRAAFVDFTTLLSHITAQAAENARLREHTKLVSKYMVERDTALERAESAEQERDKVLKMARGCGHCWPLYKEIAALEDGEQPPRQMGDR